MAQKPLFKHKFVQGLYDLLSQEFGGTRGNPLLKILFSAVLPDLPTLLKSLDDNDIAVEALREKFAAIVADDAKPDLQKTTENMQAADAGHQRN